MELERKGRRKRRELNEWGEEGLVGRREERGEKQERRGRDGVEIEEMRGKGRGESCWLCTEVAHLSITRSSITHITRHRPQPRPPPSSV